MPYPCILWDQHRAGLIYNDRKEETLAVNSSTGEMSHRQEKAAGPTGLQPALCYTGYYGSHQNLPSHQAFLTLQPAFPASLPQETFKYLKTAVRIHRVVLSPRFRFPGNLNHFPHGMVQ